MQFLLTRPLRDVTIGTYVKPEDAKISTHTPLAGRDPVPFHCWDICCISTHTPLAGRDGEYIHPGTLVVHFYSHAPCGT